MNMQCLWVVEDSQFGRELIARAAFGLGDEFRLRFLERRDGLAQSGSGDLVLLSESLLDLETRRRLFDLKREAPDVVLAVLSSDVRRDAVAAIEEAGFDYVPKPLSEPKLSALVRRAATRGPS